MPAEKLLPCPFCGYAVSWGDGADKGESDGEDRCSIVCPDCVQASAVDGSLHGVVRLWNTRAKLLEEKSTTSDKQVMPCSCPRCKSSDIIVSVSCCSCGMVS
jgi:hypothetical protein